MFVTYHYDGMLLIPVTRKGEQRTEKQGTGNGERGMGAWEWVYRSNPPENSKWWTKEKKRVWQLVLSKHSLNTIIGANSMDGKCRFYWMILPWNVDLVPHKLGFCLAYNRSQIFGELSSILSKVAQHFNNEFRHTSLRPLFSIFKRLIILQGNEVYFQYLHYYNLIML